MEYTSKIAILSHYENEIYNKHSLGTWNLVPLYFVRELFR